MKKVLTLVAISAILGLFIAQNMAFAQSGPPSLPNPFGDPVDDTIDAPPTLELADTTTTGGTTTDPVIDSPPVLELADPPPVHESADDQELPKNGPEAYFLLLLLAASLGGGYMYRLQTEKN